MLDREHKFREAPEARRGNTQGWKGRLIPMCLLLLCAVLKALQQQMQMFKMKSSLAMIGSVIVVFGVMSK